MAQLTLIRHTVRAEIKKKMPHPPLTREVEVIVTPEHRGEAREKRPNHEDDWLIEEAETETSITGATRANVNWNDAAKSVILIVPKRVDTIL